MHSPAGVRLLLPASPAFVSVLLRAAWLQAARSTFIASSPLRSETVSQLHKQRTCQLYALLNLPEVQPPQAVASLRNEMVSLPVAQAAGMRVCVGTLTVRLHGLLQINCGLGHRVRHHFRGFRLRRRRQRHDRATHRRLADPRVRSFLRLPDRAENILALLGDRKTNPQRRAVHGVASAGAFVW